MVQKKLPGTGTVDPGVPHLATTLQNPLSVAWSLAIVISSLWAKAGEQNNVSNTDARDVLAAIPKHSTAGRNTHSAPMLSSQSSQGIAATLNAPVHIAVRHSHGVLGDKLSATYRYPGGQHPQSGINGVILRSSGQPQVAPVEQLLQGLDWLQLQDIMRWL